TETLQQLVAVAEAPVRPGQKETVALAHAMPLASRTNRGFCCAALPGADLFGAAATACPRRRSKTRGSGAPPARLASPLDCCGNERRRRSAADARPPEAGASRTPSRSIRAG